MTPIPDENLSESDRIKLAQLRKLAMESFRDIEEGKLEVITQDTLDEFLARLKQSPTS